MSEGVADTLLEQRLAQMYTPVDLHAFCVMQVRNKLKKDESGGMTTFASELKFRGDSRARFSVVITVPKVQGLHEVKVLCEGTVTKALILFSLDAKLQTASFDPEPELKSEYAVVLESKLESSV